MKKLVKLNRYPAIVSPGKTIAIVLMLFLSLIYSSCTEDESIKKDQGSEEATTDIELQKLLDAGFAPESIQDVGSHFILEGDIIIPKGSLLNAEPPKEKAHGGREKQWTHSIAGLVGYVQQGAVSVRIDPSAEQWRNHIVAAVGFWNNVHNTRVNLYITNGSHVDITITGVPAPGGLPAFGAAVLPSNSNAGSVVELNSTPGFIPDWRIRTTITHEIGHTLGLLHTDSPGSNALRVPGTPASDNLSIMNSGSAPNRNDPGLNDPVLLWPGFSSWDYQSIQILYPEDYAGDRVYRDDFYSYGNSDVVIAFNGDPAGIKNHWRTQGGRIEGRAGSPLFDVEFYRTAHPDFVAIGMTREHAIDHWLNTGSNEGRASSPVFDVNYYLANNADLNQAFGTQGFQKAYYHWLNTGIDEGRVASPLFNVSNYIQRYPDILAAFGPTGYRAALYHWFFYGRGEGRIGT
jgi:hypothetical protein